ncbi:hypothetical protein EJ06DRAFT_528727 [Trichodelitschia bisporula]|uniref:Mid2 domain-containing protein n=1 Tax=Trichodelitschia bisporula TaxID=703511 RepID=A0A6G1I376_9PEZI|nr:hypothetical protein EJ06DRAFT_528727 [Trichodelitschia bisporula]
MIATRLLSALSLAASAYGLAFPSPEPTNTTPNHHARLPADWSPAPTKAPVPAIELFRRDTALYDTCGWYSDSDPSDTRPSQAITCPVGTCVLMASSGSVPGMAGCCTSFGGRLNTVDCNYISTCYDAADYSAGRCTGACSSTNRVCSLALAPYCASWTWSDLGVKDYGCAPDSASTWTAMATTYNDLVTLTAIPIIINRAATSASGSLTTSTSSSSTTLPTSSSATPPNARRPAAIVMVIAITIIILLLYACAAGLIVVFCIRHKRAMRAWAAQPQPRPYTAAQRDNASQPGLEFYSGEGKDPRTQVHEMQGTAPPTPGHAFGGPGQPLPGPYPGYQYPKHVAEVPGEPVRPAHVAELDGGR